MARQYARFDAATAGAGLAVTDGGLILTTSAAAADLVRNARSTFERNGGAYGAEFVFWGDATLLAAVGLAKAAAAANVEVGVGANTVGWNLGAGQIRIANALMVSGLSVPTKGQIIGVRYSQADGDSVVFSLDGTDVAEVFVSGSGWHFAVSMGSAVSGELSVAVNAGQWPARGAAARAGWAADVPELQTLRLADRHWLTGTSDVPANTRYEGHVTVEGIDVVQRLGFWPWADAVAARSTGAQLRVRDPDGSLTAVEYFEAPVAVRIADLDGTLATATPVARYILDGAEVVGDDLVRLRLRDAHDALDEPLNAAVFLPYVPTLAWKPQPVVIGAVASVPVLAANSDGTVGFLADAPLAHVDAVLDRGDALETGTWSLAPGSQQLLLESPPLGPVVADVSSVGPGMDPTPLSAALHTMFSRNGFAAWAQADADAIDTDTGYAGIGYYLGTEVRSFRQARDQLLANYCASAWQDDDGVLRIARLIAPEDVAAELDLQHALLDGDLTWLADNAPNLSRRMGYRPNAAPMAAGDFVTDLVDVPMARRVELMQPYRGIVYSAVPLHPRYDAADRREPMASGFWERVDAQAEIDRVCGLYSVERRFYQWSGLLETELTLGQVVRVTYDRYGLEAGRNLLVVSIQRNRATQRATIRLWGA